MIKRRAQQQGFTIVELLIVIIVIGILAAITIVAYNGISNRARIASIQSDLASAAKQLDISKVNSGTSDSYPTGIDCSSTPAANTICLTSSNGASFVYAGNGSAFCLKETVGSLLYSISSDNKAPTAIGCVAGQVTTFAGSTQGYSNGTGAGAQFGYLGQGIGIDSSGNLYVCDYTNYRIRKITTPGAVVTTFAGSGTSGSANGTGTAAQFAGLSGLAVDGNDNIYVADQTNNTIRKITPAGVVTTFAGDGTSGSANGTGVAAQFSSPAGVAVDSSNNVYVADYGNSTVRKITPAGVVTTLAGTAGNRGYADGTGATAQFNFDNQLAVDGSGTVYVSDTYNNMIRKITPAGVVTTFAGDGTGGYHDGSAASAEFNTPLGITVAQDGTLYIADQGNARIRKITPNGTVYTVAGNGTNGFADGYGSNAQFNNVGGVLITNSGDLYVMDRTNFIVRKIQ